MSALLWTLLSLSQTIRHAKVLFTCFEPVTLSVLTDIGSYMKPTSSLDVILSELFKEMFEVLQVSVLSIIHFSVRSSFIF